MARERKQPGETSRASAHGGASTKAKPRGSRKNQPSDDEVEVKTESQQFMSLPKLLKTPKQDVKDIKQFRAKVERDQKDLKKALQEDFHQADKEHARRQNAIADMISSALVGQSNAPDKGSQNSFMGTLIAQNPQLPPASEALKACGALKKRFDGMEKLIEELQLKGEEKNAMDEWNNDVEDAERKLSLGYRVAMRKTVKVLGGEDGEGKEGEMENDDAEVLGAMKGVEMNYELRNGLTYMERGIKRMVKGVPVGEMEEMEE